MPDKFIEYLRQKAEGDAMSILNIRGGSAIELMDGEIEKVLRNIQDPNMDPKAKRSCTLTLSFSPDPESPIAMFSISVKSALCGPKPHSVAARITTEGKKVIAEEINRQRSMSEIWGTNVADLDDYREEENQQ